MLISNLGSNIFMLYGQILPVLIESSRPIVLTPGTPGAIMLVWIDEERLSGYHG